MRNVGSSRGVGLRLNVGTVVAHGVRLQRAAARELHDAVGHGDQRRRRCGLFCGGGGGGGGRGVGGPGCGSGGRGARRHRTRVRDGPLRHVHHPAGGAVALHSGGGQWSSGGGRSGPTTTARNRRRGAAVDGGGGGDGCAGGSTRTCGIGARGYRPRRVPPAAASRALHAARRLGCCCCYRCVFGGGYRVQHLMQVIPVGGAPLRWFGWRLGLVRRYLRDAVGSVGVRAGGGAIYALRCVAGRHAAHAPHTRLSRLSERLAADSSGERQRRGGCAARRDAVAILEHERVLRFTGDSYNPGRERVEGVGVGAGVGQGR